jgi:signal transduction histidine kinase
MLLAGVIHQSSFAYYTGGYSSSILIWFGIIPMLSGIIAGKKGIAIWSGIVSLVAATFLYFQLIGFSFPNIISPTGQLLSHTLLIFGWIAVASSVLYLFNILIDNHEVRLKENTDKIDNLLKILLHDMSNSIHVLSGTLSYIKNDETTDSSKFRVLKKHVTFLSDMISSIKSMYVMNSQTDSLPLKEVTLNRSISLITSIIDNKLKAKNIKVNYDFEKNQHSYILASSHIFENQILQNILTNAIKFSNPNGVIDISTSTSLMDNNLLDIKIRDYGVGMSPETQENLFNPQKRTSLPGTSNEQGTGLGMLIIKNFMEKMKGVVKVTSAAGEGTEVTITFEKA